MHAGPSRGEMRETKQTNFYLNLEQRGGAPAITVGRFPHVGADFTLWENLPYALFPVAPDSHLTEILSPPLSSVATFEVGVEEQSSL